jgi:tubulin polyglutamylase TTLL6/13
MYLIARKNNLAKNLKKLAKTFTKDFKFFPKTWLIPTEMHELRDYMSK